MVTLDITAQSVRQAREKGAQLIVSHHPVIFHPLKRLLSNSVPYLLAKKGIGAICAHTNLDMAPGGVNDCLALSWWKSDSRGWNGYCIWILTLPTN